MKKAVGDSCKIIGNGGITSYQDALEKNQILDGVMTAQAAIGNPRVFVDHEPTLQERYTTIIEHLKIAIAYEIRFNQMVEQYPNNPTDTILQANKLTLHYKKKIDDDDTLVHTQKETQIHDYRLPFPQLQDIQKIADTIQPDNTDPYRAIIEFRKYLFNYIKGIPGSKECKQEIAKTQNYNELYELMKKFFHTAQNTSTQG